MMQLSGETDFSQQSITSKAKEADEEKGRKQIEVKMSREESKIELVNLKS